jgi:hypothetical protein
VSVAVGLFAPVPDFRYVGLEPVPARRVSVAGAVCVLGGSVTLATSGAGLGQALALGGIASALAALALKSTQRSTRPPAGAARMAIVPWGVLVHADAPRILRWSAVRRLEVATSRARGLWSGALSRVVVQTERDRFVGTTIGTPPLEGLVEHLDAYAEEQATPVALDLDGAQPGEALEPECESLFVAARAWLETARAATQLGLPPAGYRRASVRAPSPRAVEVLRRVLRDRTPKRADPRAFAAVIAAEVHATELVPDLVPLTQCPHPLVAAVAKQAAHKLGAARARVGTLDEVAPFLFEGDRKRLDAWARGD